jgi:hypothetical protein
VKSVSVNSYPLPKSIVLLPEAISVEVGDRHPAAAEYEGVGAKSQCENVAAVALKVARFVLAWLKSR